MHSNPSSVAMSPGSLDGWQHPNLLEIMDEGLIQHYNFSPKPTAKVREGLCDDRCEHSSRCCYDDGQYRYS